MLKRLLALRAVIVAPEKPEAYPNIVNCATYLKKLRTLAILKSNLTTYELGVGLGRVLATPHKHRREGVQHHDARGVQLALGDDMALLDREARRVRGAREQTRRARERVTVRSGAVIGFRVLLDRKAT